jgi:hypothetical protein
MVFEGAWLVAQGFSLGSQRKSDIKEGLERMLKIESF